MIMADQNGDSKAPRQAVLPPAPSRKYESRVPTLPPPAPPQPEPLTSGIDKGAGRELAPSAVPERRTLTRITRLSEYLERLSEERKAKPPSSPTFDRATYESMQRAREAAGGKMDWSDVGCVKIDPSMPSLEVTLTSGFPTAPPGEVPAGTPQVDELLSKKLWLEAGLPRIRRKKPATIEESPDIKKALDHWCISLSHPAKEVLLNYLIEDAVAEFSSLKRAAKEGLSGLVTVCSGGRPPYLVESAVATPIGTISDQFFMRLNAMKAKGLISDADAKTFVEQLVRFVFHNPRPAEGSGIAEVDMRNGFFRAVAWCICTRASSALFQEFFSRNNILLIDAVGIAAGLNSDDAKDAMGEVGMRSALYRLMKKRWVATGFEHLKETLRKDTAKGRLDPRAVFHFTTVLFREVGEYQRIVQSCSILSRNLGNLYRRGPSRDVMYLSEKEFMACLLCRGNLQPALRAEIDEMHKFVAGLFSGRAKGSLDHGEYQYAVGRSPAEISGIFNTVLEGLDFLIGDPKMHRLALEAIQHYGIAGGEGQPASFKKIFALCLFTRNKDVQDYSKLYKLLFDYADPIVSDIALDHAAYLMAKDANFLLPQEERLQESSPTLSPEDLAQIHAEGDAPF